MKLNFRKIASVLTSTVMLSSTLALAAAANAPAPFVQGGNANVAIITGSSAASTDIVAAADVSSYLSSALVSQSTSSSTVSATGGVAEDEVLLGGGVVIGKIKANLTDSEVSTLADDSFSWDDGTGSETYNYHEVIELTNASMKPLTSLDDNDLEGVALSNDKAVEYKFVFDDALNQSAVDDSTTDDADDLYLSIMGKSYQITSMDNSSITVVTSEEKALKAGESYTVNGTTINVEGVFENSVQVNGILISKGGTKKVNGIKVDVTDIGYHSNSPADSVAILKIGEDISKSYNSGDEYIGEDEDDPNWVWDISSPGYVNGYIGVKYNQKETRAKDNIIYVGESYMLPENFAEVKLVGTTSVGYEDFKVSFDDSTDLWNSTQTTSTATTADAKVIVIDGPEKDSFTTTAGSHETDKMYIRYATNTTGTESNGAYGAVEVFYEDVNGDVSDVIRPRYAGQVNLSSSSNLSVANTLGTIEVGDTTVTIKIAVVNGDANLQFINGANNVTLDIGGVNLTNSTGTFEWLGGTTETTSKEQAESADVAVSGTNVGTKDNDVMDHYGLIVATPNDNADKDVVEMSIPDDQVYAQVAVLGNGGSTSSGGSKQLGSIVVTDSQVDSVSGKNLIVVGGSCVNTVAAKLLGSNTAVCSEAFTTATGVGAGSFLIQTFASPYSSGKVATLVAGYNAGDTTNAAKYFTTQSVDTSAGKKYTGTTATQATLVTA